MPLVLLRCTTHSKQAYVLNVALFTGLVEPHHTTREEMAKDPALSDAKAPLPVMPRAHRTQLAMHKVCGGHAMHCAGTTRQRLNMRAACSLALCPPACNFHTC